MACEGKDRVLCQVTYVVCLQCGCILQSTDCGACYGRGSSLDQTLLIHEPDTK